MKRLFSPLLLAAALCLCGPTVRAQDVAKGEIVSRTADDQAVEVFTLKNSHGLEAQVLTWGATLVKMLVPDRSGKLADVTLGFDDPARYLKPHPVFGSIAGRVANRIANAQFTLDGHTFTLAKNNAPNHIHGGERGFDKRIWKGEPLSPGAVRFSLTSPDGEEGYPGRLDLSVTYTLTEKNELRLDYEARTDKPTVLNPTNHTYWNLAGTGDVLGHELRIHASRYTVSDKALIPTGELRAVSGTPLDFTQTKPVGRDIAALKVEGSGGYDHCFVIDAPRPGELTLAAEVHDPSSGRTMRVFTTEPGVQLYTANGLKDLAGRGGQSYGPHAGLCLETQHFPDSPNHPDFPSAVLRPGETFRSTTVHEFSAR
jgi:aldose 1-epimerase